MASTRHHTRIDLERLTGIRERRVSVGEEDSLSLAVGAAHEALARSRYEATDLEVIISCSITKYRDGLTQWFEPPMSMAIASAVGASGATTFDVSNACAGMLTGVFILNNWIRLGVVRRGMVVSGEYISQLGQNAARHVHNIMSRELASLTLGDAGAALILERAPEGTVGIDVAGFTTIADTPILLEEALDAAGIDITDVDWVIPHQTSARAIRKGMKEVSEALGAAPRHEAIVTVDRYGNTASTTHTVALIEELEAGRMHAGERVALVALASGLEIGVVLLTLDEELVDRYGNDDRRHRAGDGR